MTKEVVFYYATHGDAEYVVYSLSTLLRLRILCKKKDEASGESNDFIAYRVSTEGVALLTEPAHQ